MICIFMLMIALCLTELIGDAAIALLHRLNPPRAHICRARRYRFN